MIPAFGPGSVLPPFLGGDATGGTHPRSPYYATMVELVDRFGTSPERRAILRGLLNFRQQLKVAGFSTGVQWIDGSFVEDCEVVKGRPPGDVDVVSLLNRPVAYQEEDAWAAFITNHADTIFDGTYVKRSYLCDSYFIDLNVDGFSVASQAAYWFGLFSHQRLSFRWKGIIQLDLMCDDDAAMLRLEVGEQNAD